MNTASAITLTPEQGLMELTMLNAEHASQSFDDVVIDGIRGGLPPEVLMRLRALWDETRVVAGEVVAIGKVIIGEITRFLKANPGLTVGAAIGGALGAMVMAIPLIGPLVAPLFTLLGALYGGGIGSAGQKGKATISPLDAAQQLALKFFEFFAAVINAVAKYWDSKKEPFK